MIRPRCAGVCLHVCMYAQVYLYRCYTCVRIHVDMMHAHTRVDGYSCAVALRGALSDAAGGGPLPPSRLPPWTPRKSNHPPPRNRRAL